jgi:formylmethanofuran dehydrogenase subunit E
LTVILSKEKITVKGSFLGKKSKGKNGICPSCGEAYPLADGDACKGCRGLLPY